MQDKGEEVVVVENGKDVNVRKADMVLQSEAIVYFSELIEKDPNDVIAHAFRGWAWKQQKSLDNALKDYDKAVELAPGQCAWRNNRALIWIEKKDYDKAIADYDESVKLFPQYGLGLSQPRQLLAQEEGIREGSERFSGRRSNSIPTIRTHTTARRACWQPAPKTNCATARRRSNWRRKPTLCRTGRTASYSIRMLRLPPSAVSFDEAIKWQERAFADPYFIKEKGDEARKRLQLYRDKKPYREVPE